MLSNMLRKLCFLGALCMCFSLSAASWTVVEQLFDQRLVDQMVFGGFSPKVAIYPEHHQLVLGTTYPFALASINLNSQTHQEVYALGHAVQSARKIFAGDEVFDYAVLNLFPSFPMSVEREHEHQPIINRYWNYFLCETRDPQGLDRVIEEFPYFRVIYLRFRYSLRLAPITSLRFEPVPWSISRVSWEHQDIWVNHHYVDIPNPSILLDFTLINIERPNSEVIGHFMSDQLLLDAPPHEGPFYFVAFGTDVSGVFRKSHLSISLAKCSLKYPCFLLALVPPLAAKSSSDFATVATIAETIQLNLREVRDIRITDHLSSLLVDVFKTYHGWRYQLLLLTPTYTGKSNVKLTFSASQEAVARLDHNSHNIFSRPPIDI